ncbi:thiamine pyrophosphate-dependent enzyme [Rhodopila sp.]|jgi:thiamine pyrophosphate-dependent acetolactate synthase large subunit-like protein|uniref:thiamine pyrophosphate-dependent enzyme n=1 Tax=Rhodopila sp. TaxID=2480087 RepID=UPI002CFF3F1E|nr:thiamine pyrophosphate-dependent enzyme [Rhodopila sp.]HVZ08679.1 thiamine pyrophosphate-dependent enzyme [Rhodopila sp.]
MANLANHPATRDQAKVMNRFEITRRLVSLLKQDEAVIGGIGYTNFDLWAASETPSGRRQQNFYMLGSMGLAVPIALGVAIAQPTRKTFALEGDGSILMQLGALSTVAARAPKNLCIVIMDNGTYQITGGQMTMTARGADIVGIARASGLAQSAWAADEDAFAELVGRALKEDGPWLIGCRIDTGKPVDTTERDPSRIRDQFMRGLGVRK